jgi:hypothetical protein
MLQRFNTKQFQIDNTRKHALALSAEASQIGLPPGDIYHTVELVSQRTGVVLELGLDMADIVLQEQKYGEVKVFHYSNKANDVFVTVFND